ncbi:MAG TPA: di-heme oxidoredictase family protein [Gemmatimonadales bacterium]|jgi:CxxC motif-containing protein (DUF1111 family)
MSPHRRARTVFFASLIVSVAACDDAPPTAAPPPPPPPPSAALIPVAEAGSPLPDLTADQLALFERGSAVFQIEFPPENGLGPLFNATGCAGCHENPVVGGAGSNDPAEEGEDIETHATALNGGVCDNLAAVGGQVVQQQVTSALQAALGIDAEPDLPGATASGRRTTPDVFGFGLLDAVPEAEILALADPFDRNGDGISGRPHRTADGRLGRFGRKAQAATLREFNGEAFVMEMGVTSPSNQIEQTVGRNPLPDGVDPTPEPEVSQEDFDAADAFVRLLAPPKSEPLDLIGVIGKLSFLSIGCASCHVPALVTGPHRVSALSLKVVPAYTDLLLHDMGPELADICLGDAAPAEFRTEPLMGLRFGTAFLHDGRASTIGQAIVLHGGEATRARNRFLGLGVLQRAALLRFLRTL